MRVIWYVATWGLLFGLAAAGCRGSSSGDDGQAQHAGPAPEERFGNDPELVADFAALKTCIYRQGHLDYSCGPLRVLQRRLRVKARDPERREKVVTTLANLLESRRELTRLVAADSVFPHRRDPKITHALRRALDLERASGIKATLLRQLCWASTSWVTARAIALLDPGAPELVRTEAASCLGRHPAPVDPKVVAALRKALRSDPAAAVRGRACASLGALGAEQAVGEMAALLSIEEVGSHCAAALAQIGSEGAYQRLVGETEAALSRGRLPAAFVVALASFTTQPFADRAAVVGLLARAAASRQLGWATREAAVDELGHLGAVAELIELRRGYEEQRGSSEQEQRLLQALEATIRRR